MMEEENAVDVLQIMSQLSELGGEIASLEEKIKRLNTAKGQIQSSRTGISAQKDDIREYAGPGKKWAGAHYREYTEKKIKTLLASYAKYISRFDCIYGQIEDRATQLESEISADEERMGELRAMLR